MKQPLMLKPKPFLDLLVHDIDAKGDNAGLCAGFERGEWRCKQFAEHVLEWLPEFALGSSEAASLSAHNALRMIRRAARTLYRSEHYQRRGEFGEVLLHIAIRQVYSSFPLVSKIFFKNSVNDTVKGFDAVHVVAGSAGLELWLGEVKFYTNLTKAIYDVSEEIIAHLRTDYLRSEFLLISNKIDPAWPHQEEIRTLLDENTSIDQVFRAAAIPILLSYESGSLKKGEKSYRRAIEQELASGFDCVRSSLDEKYRQEFSTGIPLRVHVFLVPLESKENLLRELHSGLERLQ